MSSTLLPPVASAAAPFSWSLRRRRLFDRCKKEYYLHYYGAAGGADPYALPETRLLHRLKNMTDIPGFARRLLTDSLRKFFAGGAGDGEFFRPAVMEQASRGLADMISGRAAADHKKSFLIEMTRPKADFAALKRQLFESLEELIPLWRQGAVRELLAVPPENRVPVPFPLEVSFGELVCFAAPAAVWIRRGVLNFAETGPAEEESAALHALYAMNCRGRAPDQVVSYVLDSGQLLPIEPPVSFSAALRRIRNDADRMTVFERPGGFWVEEDFPPEQEYCENCRFRSFCQNRDAE